MSPFGPSPTLGKVGPESAKWTKADVDEIAVTARDLGGVATVANLPTGARTATIESKTNFFAAIPVGETARAECTALHRGRTTMVWQTKITRSDGRLAALVIQTQIVIPAEKS
jgi:1,4-dihydroxy-2-naphthoyl-CoA hydrolase